MKSSWGSVTRHSCSTVRPPTPESKTPIGRVSMGRSLRASMDDRYVRDAQGARRRLAPVGNDQRSRRIAEIPIDHLRSVDADDGLEVGPPEDAVRPLRP